MILDELLKNLEQKNIKLLVEGDDIVLRAPPGALDENTIKAIRDNKQSLIEVLRNGNIPKALIAESSRAKNNFRITPDMLTLVDLDQDEIDRVVEAVEGGCENIQDIYPLGPLQEGLLFHHLSDRLNDAYILRSVFEFEGRSQVDAFISALQLVIDRHDILRTAFHWDGLKQPVQVVHRKLSLPVEELRLDGKMNKAEEFLVKTSPDILRIDLKSAPLLRVYVTPSSSPSKWLLALLGHHIVADHYTLDLIGMEIGLLLQGRGGELLEPIPYRNFIAKTSASSDASHEEYFTQQLHDIVDPTAPFGVFNVQDNGAELTESKCTINGKLAALIGACARRNRVPVAVLFHVAWALVLARCCGRSDVVFGTVFSGRMQGTEAADRVIGMFMNTLPIRMRVSQGSVLDVVNSTYERLIELVDHEQASLVLAQRCSAVRSPNPLFTTVLNYRRSFKKVEGQVNGWESIRTIRQDERSNYAITLNLDDSDDEYSLDIQCAKGIEADRILSYLHTAIESLVVALEHDPMRPIESLDVLPSAELRDVTEYFTQSETGVERAIDPIALFEEQVTKWPERIAIADDSEKLTYADVNQRANSLAHHLISKGVEYQDRIALSMDRGSDMVVGMLAILKLGAVYLPLDTEYPDERMTYILADSAPSVLLTQSKYLKRFDLLAKSLPKISVDDLTFRESISTEKDGNVQRSLENPCVSGAELAYVIYTSGSTGRPKGVKNTIAGLASRLAWFKSAILHSPPITAFKTNIGFIDSVTEVLDAITTGGTLVPFGRDQVLDVRLFSSRIIAFEITNLMVVPSFLKNIIENDSFSWDSIVTLISSGERLPPSLANRVILKSPKTRLINTYGCSEVNGDATAYEYSEQADLTLEIIGRPISNTRVFILDSSLRPAPIDVIGEIYIGGVGVSLGYLSEDALTEERFVPSPFDPLQKSILYKTGDLGRWLSDGNIEYLGRNDFQVKVRGVRIELGEVENRLLSHPRVKDCVVFSDERVLGDVQLNACVVVNEPIETSGSDDSKDGVGFSLFFFGAQTNSEESEYRLYLDAARFADANDFEAIWTPERHFSEVAGLYPNPSILSAAIATITNRIHLRAGSVVLPLHNTLRVAEEWSVVDNLSNGRVGVSIATGWLPRDFVLAPGGWVDRKNHILDNIRDLRRLWRGDCITLVDGKGDDVEVGVFPKPIQSELPLWYTTVGNPDSFEFAASQGMNVLTHLLGQSIDDVSVSIMEYRASLKRHGYDPATRKVTLMIHTFVGENYEETLEKARGPFNRYMRSHLGLLKSVVKSLKIMVEDESQSENIESIAEHAFERYTSAASLIGTPSSCLETVRRLRAAGVDEIACLFDWMDARSAMEGLPYLKDLRDLALTSAPSVTEIHDWMAVLPDAMRPSRYMFVSEIPLVPSGKVDREALLGSNTDSRHLHVFEEPQGSLENALAHLWRQVLHVDRIGRFDDFFALGGHSLRVVALVSYINHALGVEVPVGYVFKNPTIAAIAEHIAQMQIDEYERSDVARVAADIEKMSEEEIRAALSAGV